MTDEKQYTVLLAEDGVLEYDSIALLTKEQAIGKAHVLLDAYIEDYKECHDDWEDDPEFIGDCQRRKEAIEQYEQTIFGSLDLDVSFDATMYIIPCREPYPIELKEIDDRDRTNNP